MTIKDKLTQIIHHLPPSLQLRELEKLSMEIRKANGLRIANETFFFGLKYPKVREESNKYKM